jgi:RNA polymerase sigma-70 factor (ECF subfamily)
VRRDELARAYDAHAAPLYRFLSGFLGGPQDAEDVLQSVFAKLAERRLEEIDDLGAYLWTAARNEARSVGRRRPGPYLLSRPGVREEPGEREAVERALASLPAEQREVVLLRVFEELTFEETAERLGISPDTAASRFRYAKEKLKEVLCWGDSAFPSRRPS